MAGCQSNTGVGNAGEQASFEVGANKVGESCRVEESHQGISEPELVFQADVKCGAWEQPSARIRRVATVMPLDQLATSGNWRRQIEEQSACGAPEPSLILGDVPAMSLSCTIRRGGWQYKGLIARIGSDTYFVESIPATMSAAIRGVAVLAGRESAVEGRDGAPTRDGDTLYSAGDLQSFQALLSEAQYFNYTGNYPEAEKRYREALRIQQDSSEGGKDGLGYVLMHLALELSNQERFAEAETVFTQAAEAISYSVDPTDEATLTSYQAIHFANQRRYRRAIELANQASTMRLALARQFNIAQYAAFADAGDFNALVSAAGGNQPMSGNVGLVGRADTALGDVVQSKYIEAAMLTQIGELSAAQDALGEAERVLTVDARAPRRWEPQIRYLQGVVAERDGDLETAEKRYVEAAQMHRALSTGPRNQNIALLALGRVLGDQQQLDSALDVFRSAFANMRDQHTGMTYNDAEPYFEIALAKAEAEPDERDALYEEMFEVAQTVRGSLTAQTIALAAARLSSGDAAVGKAIRELQDARRMRDTVQYQLTVAQSDPATLQPQLDGLSQRLSELERSVGTLERTVQVAAPLYNQLIDAPVTVDALSSVLAQDEAMFQVLVGEKGSIGFFVDGDGVEAFSIDLTERQAREFVSVLRVSFDVIVGAPFNVGRAYTLHETLLGPVRDRLAKIRHLITVPSGPLLSLPFGVLVTDPPDEFAGDYQDIEWLATRHAVTLSPSVQSLISLRTSVQPSRASRQFVGFGDFVPALNVDTLIRDLALPDRCRPAMRKVADLEPLPGTKRELEAVAKSLQAPASSIYLGERFTEATVAEADLADYRIVYFATHAILPIDFTCWPEPQLIASPVAAPGVAQDGLIDARDILEFDLDADLVVLSACNTAAPGGQTSGESLSGLARAFFYAGARSLIVSHWQIPDDPTTQFMTKVFSGLAGSGQSTAEAIRRAQTAMIADGRFAHPLNWAAFSLVGDGGRRLGNVRLAASD